VNLDYATMWYFKSEIRPRYGYCANKAAVGFVDSLSNCVVLAACVCVSKLVNVS